MFMNINISIYKTFNIILHILKYGLTSRTNRRPFFVTAAFCVRPVKTCLTNLPDEQTSVLCDSGFLRPPRGDLSDLGITAGEG